MADFLNVKLKMKFGAIIAQCLFDSYEHICYFFMNIPQF